MVTQYSAWVGGSTKGRIRCDHAVTYTADHTQAIFNGTLYLETDQTTTDNVNTWAVSGSDGSHSGSNLAINFGSGGGLKAVWTFSFQQSSDGSLGCSVYSIEAVGQTVSGTFTLDAGGLAPYFSSTAYSTRLVTPSGFTTTGISGNGNGGTLTNVQLEVNTSASDTGAVFFVSGAWVDAVATGLNANTLYYYRIRIANSTYGWSAWGPWKTVTTASGLPSAPTSAWYVGPISQTTADINGNAVSDTGGSPITGWDCQWNTIADPTGATLVTSNTPPTIAQITGLFPYKVYYVRIRAKNVNGYGAWSSWVAFTTLPGAFVSVGGVWKPAIPYVRVGGVWKQSSAYINKTAGTTTIWKH